MKYRVPIFVAEINNITTMKKIIVFRKVQSGVFITFINLKTNKTC